MRVPGAAWVALIALVTTWLTDTFPGEYWLAGVVAALGLVAKMIEVYWPKPEPTNERMMTPQPPRSKTARLFFGG